MSSYNNKLKLYGLRQNFPGEESGYYFVLVHETKEKKFLQAMKKETPFDLQTFGDIIHSGYGPPPQELIKKLEAEYKVEFLS